MPDKPEEPMTKEKDEMPPKHKEYLAKGERRTKAKQEGRLWRVKHPKFGHLLVEAKDANEALKAFASEKNLSTAKEFLEALARDCRVAKVNATPEVSAAA
jgi:hypothetical protein